MLKAMCVTALLFALMLGGESAYACTPAPTPGATTGYPQFGVQLLSNEKGFDNGPALPAVRTRVILQRGRPTDLSWAIEAAQKADKLADLVIFEYWIQEPGRAPHGDCSTVTAVQHEAVTRQLVQAVADHVDVYEIDNEPDHEPRCDPYGYALQFSRAAKAIKQLDPGAKVIPGGFAWDSVEDRNWVDLMFFYLSHLEGFHQDAIAIHMFDDLRGRWPGGMEPKYRDVQGFLARWHQPGLPVWVTEAGDEVGTPPDYELGPQGEEEQALGVLRVMKECVELEVPVCVVYRLQDESPGGRQYGLVRFDKTTRPAWDVFTSFLP